MAACDCALPDVVLTGTPYDFWCKFADVADREDDGRYRREPPDATINRIRWSRNPVVELTGEEIDELLACVDTHGHAFGWGVPATTACDCSSFARQVGDCPHGAKATGGNDVGMVHGHVVRRAKALA